MIWPDSFSARDGITHRSTAEAKIALFRSLFRGRDDVYPRRFESRSTGRSGYQPDCANEWARGICEKPRIKCTDCLHQRFRTVTDETIRQHLSGRDRDGKVFVMGIYPMLLDETCFFLAIDFDRREWRDDARAYRDTCRRLNIPVAVERSRSGNGAHIWIFFAEAIPALIARKLGSHLLTETLERRPDVRLGSYDRLFPNQDTLPKGGFGNLIALPLQGEARKLGNSLFLDDDFEPYSDQWEFLAGVRKIERSAIEQIVRTAETTGRVIGVRPVSTDEVNATPWILPPSRRRPDPPIVGPLPQRLEIVLADEMYIAKADVPSELINRLARLAAFQNPEFHKAQAMRLPTFDKPRIIACAEEHAEHISLPRGCLEDVRDLLASLGIAIVIQDKRNPGRPLDVQFHGSLRDEQNFAANAMLGHDIGVLSATTAFGKTVIGAWLIAQRRVNTLVLVHRRQLLEQWIERLGAFLRLELQSIGQIGGGRNKPNGLIDVALIQSMVRKGVVDDRLAEYGQVIVDECHHVPAFSLERVIRRARAKYVAGLSATLVRKDGHHPIIFMQCGPVRHHVDAKKQAAARPFDHRVIVRPTNYRAARQEQADVRFEFHAICNGLIADEARNRMIVADIGDAVRAGRSPIVLTERNEHVERLATQLSPLVRHVIVLRGGAGRRELRATGSRLASIPLHDERVLLATGRYAGEGFDDARLDTLFITMPVSWRGIVAQYVGRLHRLNDRKREVLVYDYADLNEPMLARMFDRRCRGYEAVGYTVLVPASAVPGWPSDVALPVDPSWKSDYAASVQRLIRDGVDARLGNLFIEAAKAIAPTAEGEERARSAVEAFLYRRLQMLPATAGRFRLNAELPIMFGGQGRLEVDLLCPDARLAIELDGLQHLASTDAYRRDRLKDRVLQENGYFVLRFLAEDVSKRLDMVLDSIQRTLVRCMGPR
jgi:superfamily II DNA or RNA helicase/very-short-patch-repair endonuclease